MKKSCFLSFLWILTFWDTSYGAKSWTEVSKKDHGLVLAVDKKNHYCFPKSYNGHVNPSPPDVFFCPVETDLNCLLPAQNNNIFCKKSVEPMLIKSEFEAPCGIDGKSVYYDFVYRICVMNEIKPEDDEHKKKKPLMTSYDQVVYRICFNPKNRDTVYAFYKIPQTSLFKNDYIILERDVEYKLSTTPYQLKDNNFAYLKSMYKWYKVHHHKSLRFFKLKRLMLASPHDMAFALQKKPTYHYGNIKPAWQLSLKIWDSINKTIRNNAIEEKLEIIVLSGSYGELELDNIKVYLDDQQKVTVPSYYWKLFYIPRDSQLLTLIVHNVPRLTYNLEKLCSDDDFHAIDFIKSEWRDVAYFCNPDTIIEKYAFPHVLNFMENNENFLPLIMKSYDKTFEFPKTYDGLKSEDNTFFCYDENDTLQTKNRPDAKKYENCLIPHQRKNPYCRKPLHTFSTEGEKDVPFCQSINELYFNEVFRICSKYQLSNDIIPIDKVIYSYCFNTHEQSTLFTYHRILSPALLVNKHLKQERKAIFRLEKFDDPPIRNYYHSVNDSFNTDVFYETTYGTITYMTLISPHDMPFAIWRKSAFLSRNTNLAWGNIIKLWDIINKRIRTQAIIENQELIQINGWDGDLKIEGSRINVNGKIKKLPVYFWKLVYNQNQSQSIAIILHNVPSVKYLQDKLCHQSYCTIQNWDYMRRIDLDDFAYCCHPSVITNKYQFPRTNEILTIREYYKPVLYIFYNGVYHFPDVYEGLFQSEGNSERINTFFCPDEKSHNDYFLVPNANVIPYCTKPVKPYLMESDKACGLHNRNKNYYFIFWILTISPNKPEQIHYENIIYEFCYDPKIQFTIYTLHKIKSPSLFKNKILEIERKIMYPLDYNDYGVLKTDLIHMKEEFSKNRIHIFNASPAGYLLEPLMLVSPDDVPFEIWKKAMYHLVNVRPAWKYVTYVWNEINEHLRKLAIQQKHELLQINGSSSEELRIDGRVVYLDEAKQYSLPKYFWKVVYNWNMSESITIVLHNVPNTLYFDGKVCETSIPCKIEQLRNNEPYPLEIGYCCDTRQFAIQYKLLDTKTAFFIGEILLQRTSDEYEKYDRKDA